MKHQLFVRVCVCVCLEVVILPLIWLSYLDLDNLRLPSFVPTQTSYLLRINKVSQNSWPSVLASWFANVVLSSSREIRWSITTSIKTNSFFFFFKVNSWNIPSSPKNKGTWSFHRKLNPFIFPRWWQQQWFTLSQNSQNPCLNSTLYAHGLLTLGTILSIHPHLPFSPHAPHTFVFCASEPLLLVFPCLEFPFFSYLPK